MLLGVLLPSVLLFIYPMKLNFGIHTTGICKCCLQRFLAVHKLNAPLLCLSVAPDLLLLLNQSIIRPILLYCCVCFLMDDWSKLKCITHSAIIDHKTFQSSLFVRLFVRLWVFGRREKSRDCLFCQAIPKVSCNFLAWGRQGLIITSK